MTISVNQANELIRFSIQTRIPLFLAGATGVGKSASVKTAINSQIKVPVPGDDGFYKSVNGNIEFKSYKYRMQTLRLASKDETDIEGIPFVNKETAETHYARPSVIVPYTDSYEDTPPTVYFCDEINRWPAQVRQTLMSAFHDNDGTGRYLGEHKIRDLDVFVCAFNPAADGYDVDELDQALLCRGSQVAVTGTAKEWKRWALKAGIEGDLVEFFAQGDPMNLATDFTPSTKKNPRTCEYAARSYMLWSQLDESERPKLNDMIQFMRGLIGSQAENITAFLSERSSRPIPAADMMSMKLEELKTYLKGLAKSNRNDVFNILKDNMDNYLNDKPEGLNKVESDSVMAFLENIPKDILSEMMSNSMSAGTNTGNILGELATDSRYEERMSKLMEESLDVGSMGGTRKKTAKKA